MMKFKSLAALEAAGRELINQEQREKENAECAKLEQEHASIAKAKQAVLDHLVDTTGLENGEELEPLLTVHYGVGVRFWGRDAYIAVPGTDEKVTFYYELHTSKDSDQLEVKPGKPYPYSVQSGKKHYATLHEALAHARIRHQSVVEYARVSDEVERVDAELYAEHEAQKALERNDRVSFLVSLINEHPIVLPLLKTLKAYFDREAELEDELAEAWDEADF